MAAGDLGMVRLIDDKGILGLARVKNEPRPREMSGEDDEGFVIRIRGLPWSSTKEEILKFFSSCKIKGGVEGIHMTLSREGRPSGECYVELETDDDMQKGLDKHNEHMGHRYIEVFKSKRSEMEWVVKRSGAHQEDSLNDGCIRLRGLPFGCSKEEIAQFFSGLEIVPNGITLPTDYQGRSTGEAFVQFASRDIAENAMGKHKEKIGHRYIEIFKSSLQEVRAALGMGVSKMRQMGSARPSPYDRNDRFGGPTGRYGGGASRGGRNFRGMMNDDDFGNYGGGNFGAGNFGRGGMRGNAMNSFGNRNMGGGGGGGMGNNRFMGNGGGGGGFSGNNRPFNNSGHFVHMRGLPFRAIEQDVFDFFRPINPINVHILYEDGGRPSGEADVEFAAHEDAVKAMSKDKSHMQHRYIELFLNSTPNPMGGGNANTGNGGAIGLGNAGNFGNNMNAGMGGTGGGMGNAGGLGGGGMGNAGGNMGGGGGGGMGFGNNQMGNSFGGAAGRMGTGLNNLGMGNMNSGSGMGGGGNNPGGNFYGTGGGGGGMGGMGNSGMGGMGNAGMGGGMGGNMGGGMGMGQVGMMGVPDFTNF